MLKSFVVYENLLTFNYLHMHFGEYKNFLK